MVAQWFLPIIISAVCLGFYDISKKRALKDNSVMPVLFIATVCGTVFFVLSQLILLPFEEFCGILLAPGRFLWLVWLKSLLVASSWICVYYAMRDLPLTLASPIRASSPLWVCLGGLLLFGEIPSLRSGLGMLLIFSGYYCFSVIGKLEGFPLSHPGVRLIILGTLLSAGSALYDKFLLGVAQVPRQIMQLHFSLDLIVILGLAWLIRRKCFHTGRNFIWRWSIPVTGVLLIFADYFYFYALSLPEVKISVLSLIRRSNCIIAFLVGGWWMFKDKDLVRKALALVLILLGVTLLSK